MRIPNNIIIKDQYTIGDEFVDPTTNKSYQGFYYELNGSFFQGKTFNPSSPKLIRKINENTLLNNPKTSTFSKVSGITSQQLQPPVLTYNYEYEGKTLEFYVKQINTDPFIIKNINEETYRHLRANPYPLYQIIFIGTFENQTITPEQAYLQMSGLKEWLSG